MELININANKFAINRTLGALNKEECLLIINHIFCLHCKINRNLADSQNIGIVWENTFFFIIRHYA
ncbi:MAG TPA: hypothetical protein DEH02_13365 [Bacteroidales bacterium]|nr:MAG: hypothetical protein A2X01_13655 [Bacteroidetes bacterium GWF2_35_48]OFY94434.1 MAG: hypothetical protein A2491_06135 [Bacteroidetes bacterium RIFOXYC12_FULL_35_7]HBX52048.1 hypothetical protein [Bacteroidales bacterium]